MTRTRSPSWVRARLEKASDPLDRLPPALAVREPLVEPPPAFGIEPSARNSVHRAVVAFAETPVSLDRDARPLESDPGEVRWLDAQTHSGENIGSTPTHVLFVELKEVRETAAGGTLGPS